MENSDLKQTQESLEEIKKRIKEETEEEIKEATDVCEKLFNDTAREANLNLLMPESVFVAKYLPLFAQLAVNKDFSVTETPAWKEWMSMTIGGIREVGIVADADLNLTAETEVVKHTEEFPHAYVTHHIENAKVLYKVPPIISSVKVNVDAVKNRVNEMGVEHIADLGVAIQTGTNYSPAKGLSMLNQTVSAFGQNAYPNTAEYKERWKEILYRYYKPEAAKKQVEDKEEADKEYDELW